MRKILIMNDTEENKKPAPKSFLQTQTMTIRGGLIGIAITAFLSWNTGKYNKIGNAIRRAKFVRSFISLKKIYGLPMMTTYDQPQLNSVASNFFCYSGQPGIGKSYHFQHLVAKQSLTRPALYLSFKTVGKDTNFQNDIAEQISFGEDGTAIISEIIRAVKRIHVLNKKPERFWLKYLIWNSAFLTAQVLTFFSSLDAVYGMLGLSGIIASHMYAVYFLQPFLIQTLRKTVPLIVMDDLNKIQHMNMLSQVVRFLKLIEQNASNIMLVSSDEQTWAHLRKQPGMKDRLRVRQLKYNHKETSKKLLEIVDSKFQVLVKQISAHKIYDKQLVKALIKQLLGVRQMTLRRFISVLKLNDEQEYEKLLQILKSRQEKSSNTVISEFTKVLFQTQTQTMVANLKTIKRELKDMSETDYIQNLKLLLNKFKLPSDNKIASHLKVFNIVRDLRSQYVVNGRFMYIIYQMAVQEYELDCKQYRQFKSQKEKTPQTVIPPITNINPNILSQANSAFPSSGQLSGNPATQNPNLQIAILQNPAAGNSGLVNPGSGAQGPQTPPGN